MLSFPCFTITFWITLIVEVSVRVQSMGQTDLFENHLYQIGILDAI